MLVDINTSPSDVLTIVFTDIDEHKWIVSTCHKGVVDGEPLLYAMEVSKPRM